MVHWRQHKYQLDAITNYIKQVIKAQHIPTNYKMNPQIRREETLIRLEQHEDEDKIEQCRERKQHPKAQRICCNVPYSYDKSQFA
jgi:hypothetical protein